MGILKIGVVGCGRIGKLHINNLINSVPGVQVVAAADPMLDKSGAREWLAERKITNVSTDFMDVINNPEVDVVFVCSSTDTHCDVSMAAVQAGKHVFCEKPIDYDIDKIKKLLALVEEKGVKFQVGFNRRFDHNHKAVADAVKDGTIGDPHIVIVSSRDPEPPPASYVAVSGGIFYDMMIHDFDMVRYVTGSEAVEISAVGSCLVNPNLQEESGIPDVDTAVVTMKMANGCIAVINNSRQAVYGYDQRVEAFGSKGMASDANDLLNTTTVLTKDGAHSEKPLWFFLERYNQAFINQVISFVDAINNDTETAVGAIDGLRPVLMAKAATESCQAGGVFVKVGEYLFLAFLSSLSIFQIRKAAPNAFHSLKYNSKTVFKVTSKSQTKLFKRPKGLAACKLQAAGPFAFPLLYTFILYTIRYISSIYNKRVLFPQQHSFP